MTKISIQIDQNVSKKDSIRYGIGSCFAFSYRGNEYDYCIFTFRRDLAGEIIGTHFINMVTGNDFSRNFISDNWNNCPSMKMIKEYVNAIEKNAYEVFPIKSIRMKVELD